MTTTGKKFSDETINLLENRGNLYINYYTYNGVKRPRIRFALILSNLEQAKRLHKDLGVGSLSTAISKRNHHEVNIGGADIPKLLNDLKPHLSFKRMQKLDEKFHLFLKEVKEVKYSYAHFR